MAAMLGIGDGVLNTQLNALLGMLFKHNMVNTRVFSYIKALRHEYMCMYVCISDMPVYLGLRNANTGENYRRYFFLSENT